MARRIGWLFQRKVCTGTQTRGTASKRSAAEIGLRSVLGEAWWSWATNKKPILARGARSSGWSISIRDNRGYGLPTQSPQPYFAKGSSRLVSLAWREKLQ
jgi:hypothetical protein